MNSKTEEHVEYLRKDRIILMVIILVIFGIIGIVLDKVLI